LHTEIQTKDKALLLKKTKNMRVGVIQTERHTKDKNRQTKDKALLFKKRETKGKKLHFKNNKKTRELVRCKDKQNIHK